MIIVTGDILARPDTFEQLRDLCVEHSRRSRGESGCVSHNSYVDNENPLRIFFFERWADRASLEAHFAAPEANTFMRQVRALSAGGSKGPQIIDIP